mgnify:CR=1 FL=1
MVYARLILMRLFKAVIVLFLIVIFNFLLIQLAPGDPAAILAGEAGAADQEFLNQLRERFGLNEPITTQLYRKFSSNPDDEHLENLLKYILINILTIQIKYILTIQLITI